MSRGLSVAALSGPRPHAAGCGIHHPTSMVEQPEQTFRVLPRQVGQTVAAALRQWLPDRSWGQIERLLRSRHVLICGNLCLDGRRRLKLQDVVKVLDQSAPPLPREDDVRVVYLDEHLIVVDKPASVTTTRHREERGWPARRRQWQPTLDEMLPQIIARIDRRRSSRRGPPPVRAVHRLDRETSGLMVFARTVVAERHLGQQFRQHTTHRRYLAVVQGVVEAQTFASRLVRDRGDGRRGSTEKPNVGKPAVTHVEPVERLGPYTLIRCRLETGRTHQIRIHLAEAGHPLCGERVYHRPLFGEPAADASHAPRLALHAAELGFVHPATGETMRFESPLPKDLRRFVDRLRHAAASPSRSKGQRQQP
jgi:23S rRNA pseudouridine1911/1915/1917 synthase